MFHQCIWDKFLERDSCSYSRRIQKYAWDTHCIKFSFNKPNQNLYKYHDVIRIATNVLGRKRSDEIEKELQVAEKNGLLALERARSQFVTEIAVLNHSNPINSPNHSPGYLNLIYLNPINFMSLISDGVSGINTKLCMN